MRKIIVDGFLGSDPEIKTTKNGQQYMTFRMGSTEYGEKKSMWFRCTTFNQNDIARLGKYLKKGSGVVVDGSYENSTYQNPNTHEIIVDNNIICSSIDFMRSNKAQQAQDGQSVVQAQLNQQVNTVTQQQAYTQPTYAQQTQTAYQQAPVQQVQQQVVAAQQISNTPTAAPYNQDSIFDSTDGDLPF